MKQLIYLNQNGRTNLTDPFSGVAQLSGLQAIDSLPNEVGYDDSFTIDWHFSVANNEFYSANSSKHKIYRTLDTPSAHYHTSVDVACNGVSGSDETSVFNAIWGKFTGLNITSADGYPMTYWGSGANTPNSLAELVSLHDGRCGAWAIFFGDVLDVHSIISNQKVIIPYWGFLFAFIENNTFYSFYGTPYLLHIWQSQQAQNNSQPSCIFLDHQVVIYNNKIYDPSYGQCYTSLAEWEASSVSDFTVRYDDNGILKSRVLVNPPSTTECDYDTNY